eukprot:362754-Chlamydomonas_euryale.AAC.8
MPANPGVGDHALILLDVPRLSRQGCMVSRRHTFLCPGCLTLVVPLTGVSTTRPFSPVRASLYSGGVQRQPAAGGSPQAYNAALMLRQRRKKGPGKRVSGWMTCGQQTATPLAAHQTCGQTLSCPPPLFRLPARPPACLSLCSGKHQT